MTQAISLKSVALFALLTLATFGITFAGPGGKKAQSVSNQIHEMIAYPEVKVDLTGEALLVFTVNEDSEIKVKGVFGTNDELIHHIETTLKDKSVDLNGLENDGEFQVKIKFNDIR